MGIMARQWQSLTPSWIQTPNFVSVNRDDRDESDDGADDEDDEMADIKA